MKYLITGTLARTGLLAEIKKRQPSCRILDPLNPSIKPGIGQKVPFVASDDETRYVALSELDACDVIPANPWDIEAVCSALGPTEGLLVLFVDGQEEATKSLDKKLYDACRSFKEALQENEENHLKEGFLPKNVIGVQLRTEEEVSDPVFHAQIADTRQAMGNLVKVIHACVKSGSMESKSQNTVELYKNDNGEEHDTFTYDQIAYAMLTNRSLFADLMYTYLADYKLPDAMLSENDDPDAKGNAEKDAALQTVRIHATLCDGDTRSSGIRDISLTKALSYDDIYEIIEKTMDGYEGREITEVYDLLKNENPDWRITPLQDTRSEEKDKKADIYILKTR